MYLTKHLKGKYIVRFLSIISLMIFFLPFFQTCSDKYTIEESGYLKSYGNAKTEKEKESAFKNVKRDFSVSGYDLAMTFDSSLLNFTAIMILNITIFVLAFRGHKKLLFLSFLNLALIIFSFVLLIFALPGLGHIRYGMYVCLANALLLFYFILFIKNKKVYRATVTIKEPLKITIRIYQKKYIWGWGVPN